MEHTEYNTVAMCFKGYCEYDDVSRLIRGNDIRILNITNHNEEETGLGIPICAITVNGRRDILEDIRKKMYVVTLKETEDVWFPTGSEIEAEKLQRFFDFIDGLK